MISPSRSKSFRVLGLAILLGVAPFLTIPAQADSTLACSSNEKLPQDLGTLVLASIPANLPSAQWGIDQGCFQKYGLTVKPVVVASTQIGMAGLVSGSYDLFMNTPSNLVLFMANSNFDGVIVAPRHTYTAAEISRAQQDPLYPGALLLQTIVLVKKDSSIKSWKDLEKRKIGVKSFHGSDQGGILMAMRQVGADSSKTEFLALTDAQMGPAMERGDVDAVVPSDPFATQLILGGARPVGYPQAYFAKPGVAVAYLSSAKTINQKTSAMRAFQKAILEINHLLNQPTNDSSYRKTIASVTGSSDATVAKLHLPTMSEKNVSFSEIAYIPNRLKSLKFITTRVNLSTALFK